MTDQTLINLYSLYIQISGIVIALVAVYAFFKKGKIQDLLIGQGNALYKSQEDIRNQVIDGPSMSDKYFRRLRDAIDRKNIYGIMESLIRLSIVELESGKSENNKFANYNHILPIFISTYKNYNHVKFISLISIILLTFTIILCIISIIYTDIYYVVNNYNVTIIYYIVSLVLGVSLAISGYFIFISINKKIGFEKVKKELCNSLRSKYPDIDKLF